jgi:1-acyl-sn-glycerol-3-phosphate acyltransferase
VGLRDDLGLASLDVVELLAQAERERGAPPSALRPVRTAGVNPAVLPSGGLPPPGPPDKATLADIAAAFATVVPDARAHRLPPHQPPWSRWLPLRAARPPARALALGLWRLARADVRACWHADPGALRPPLFVVAAPHRHWLDAFALAAALPTRVRRRLLVVTNHDFGPWFAPRPGTPWREIVASAAGYFVGLPLLFEFAILTPDARARVGLTEIAGALDRGLCPLWFPHGLRFGPPQPQAPGLALLALETGHAILPAHVEADHGAFGWRPRRPRPRVVVHFGSALRPGAGEPREALMARLDEALGALSERAPSCGFRSAATSPRSR